MNSSSLFAASLLALLITSGCASYNGSHLVPGNSTAAEVRATMGDPAEKTQAGNETLWWYPRKLSRENYAVIVGTDNIVKGVEQRLTEANLKHIATGQTTSQDVRALMGPAHFVVRYRWRDGDSWEYRMNGGLANSTGSISEWMVLSVRFDSTGIVRDVTYIADPDTNCPLTCDEDKRPP